MGAVEPQAAHPQAPPRHVAIIMDGNGRWASRRRLPRFAGHKAGLDAVRRVVRACGEKGVEVLTLFAFSSENWRRPEEEVGLLIGLFMTALEQQVKKLHEHRIRLRVIGDRSAFGRDLQARIEEAEALTRDNARQVQSGDLAPADIDPARLQAQLALSTLPEPDLFIRTGGEKRISNFLLWQLAYTELYFTDTLWPDFDRHALEGAFASFATRQRRFGRTAEQVTAAPGG